MPEADEGTVTSATERMGRAPAGREPVRGMGLCLSGGGITGAMYQVGCLAAIEDAIEGFSACDFDVYVGSSSGATVATALAGGLSAQRMYRALLDPADDFFPLQRHHLMRIDGKEWRRVWGTAFHAARRLLSSATSRPLEIDVWIELDRFYDSLPAGIFKLDAYEKFVADFMRRRGIAETFEAMPRRLRLVATDLDAGDRAVFGAGELADVPVAQAVAACSAVPLLFAPVRLRDRDYIDAGVGEVAHVDLAESLGCDQVIVINPMVPIIADHAERTVPTGHGPRRRIRDKGLLWVHNQSFRIRTELRFRKLLDVYSASHPGTEVVLLEPAPDDATLFLYSPMNFAARRAILEDAYTATMRQLKDESSDLHRALAKKRLEPSAIVSA